MPPSMTDASSFLDSVSFNADELKAAKVAIHESDEFRSALKTALGGLPSDAAGKDALRRATALYLLSKPDAALQSLGDGNGSAENGDTPQVALLRGLTSLELGDPTSAATAFGSLVGTDMEGESFLMLLATAAALAGDTAMAQKAAAKLPEGADALYAEGIALESDGEYEEARRKYEESIARDGNHARALFRLALRLDTDGEDERAIELYNRCIALNPTHANALQNLALLYEDHGRYSEAEACYRRVLAADPGHARARIGLKDVAASLNMYYDEDHERREDRRAQVLRTPISEFELSVRSRNCLAKMNIQSLGDLVRKSEQELLAYKNFGETSLQEIKDILAQKGLRLGMSNADDAPLYTATRQQAEAQLDALFGAPAPAPSGPIGAPAPAAPLGAAPAAGGGLDPLEVPIEQLDLSIRARRCMENLEIRTVGDLVRHSEAELLASKNFGQTSLNEVRRKLDSMGMGLRRK